MFYTCKNFFTRGKNTFYTCKHLFTRVKTVLHAERHNFIYFFEAGCMTRFCELCCFGTHMVAHIRQLGWRGENTSNSTEIFRTPNVGNYIQAIEYLTKRNFKVILVGNNNYKFKKFSINIGERQTGRIKAKSVIDCNSNTKSIMKAINFALEPANQKKIKDVVNPYGKGGASKKIINVLKSKNFKKLILKEFFNIRF